MIKEALCMDENARLLHAAPIDDALAPGIQLMINPDAAAVHDWRVTLPSRLLALERAGLDVDTKEAHLNAVQAGLDPSVCAARWKALACERAVLAERWAALTAELALYGTEMRALKGRCTHDFEPGDVPVRDVWCSVITHQFDFPCFSCCFQR
eukprot:jgi/Botrbrau1/7073/Bobra.0165s0095.1